MTVISARLNTHPVHGAVVRLTNYGFTFATLPVPVQRGEEPTEFAERALAEYGWHTTEAWWSTGTAWITHVAMTADTPTT